MRKAVQDARQARRDTVMFLRSKGYTFNAIAVVLGVSPERALQLHQSETWREKHRQRTRAKMAHIGITPSQVRAYFATEGKQ